MVVLSLVALLIGVRANVDLALRQELRARSSYPSDVRSSAVASDMVLAPLAGLDVKANDLVFKLSYSPRFIVPEFYARFQPQTLHSAGLSFSTPIGTRVDVAIDERGAYGDIGFQNLVLDPAATQTGLQPVPQTLYTRYVSTSTHLAVGVQLVPRLRLELVGDHSTAGGANLEAQFTFPLRHATVAGPRFALMVTELDKLIFTATGARTGFSNGILYYSVESTVAWSRRFSRVVEGQVGAGVATITQSFNPGWTALTPFPVLQLSVGQAYIFGRDRTLEIQTFGSLAPYFDRLTTLLYQRLQLGVTATAVLLKPLALQGSGTYVLALPTSTQSGTNIGMFQTAVTSPFHPNFEAVAGLMLMMQRATDAPTTFVQWIGFVGIAVKERF